VFLLALCETTNEWEVHSSYMRRHINVDVCKTSLVCFVVLYLTRNMFHVFVCKLIEMIHIQKTKLGFVEGPKLKSSKIVAVLCL